MLHDFILKNWFDLLQSAFIVGGFMLSYYATRSDNRSRKVEHLLQLNQSHREIWGKTYSHPELLRIKRADVNLQKHPITASEKRFAIEIIMHIYSVYEAIQSKQFDGKDVEKDIVQHLQLPIPNTIWQEVKEYHDRHFVRYIDGLLAESLEGKKG